MEDKLSPLADGYLDAMLLIRSGEIIKGYKRLVELRQRLHSQEVDDYVMNSRADEDRRETLLKMINDEIGEYSPALSATA